MRPARLRDSLANSLWLIPMLFAVTAIQVGELKTE
jgi:hypothetical protein